MFAVFQGFFRQLVVSPHRGDHGDGVDLRRSQQLVGIRYKLDPGMRFFGPRARSRTFIADHLDLR